MIVVDASLFIGWLLNEQDDQSARAFFQDITTQPAMVPAHWPNEIANALRRAVRTKRLPPEEIEWAAEELSNFQISLAAPPLVADIAKLAQDALALDLSVYDLQYVRLAQTLGAPLATNDMAMRRAAERLHVILYAPKR